MPEIFISANNKEDKMTLDYQNMIKASKIKHINIHCKNIFENAMADKTSFFDIETLDKYEIKNNKIYIKDGFLNTLTFVGYTI